jgi:hypothetical protein
MAKSAMSVRIGRRVTNRKARAAIEQAVAAERRRRDRDAAQRLALRRTRAADISAIIEPVASLVKGDPAATRSIARLGAGLEKNKIRLSKTAQLSPGTAVPLSIILHEHLEFQFPPYDYEWNWGNDRQHSSNRGTGYIGVLGDSGSVGGATGDAVAAACGIGFVFNSDSPGQVSIRPLVQHSWEYLDGAYGIGSWASSKGGIDISAWQGSTMVAGVSRAQLFSDSTCWAGSGSDQGDGYAWVPDLTISFSIAASTWYAVSIGAWVECDHASGLGASRGQGKVEGYVRWTTVERWT